MSFILNVNFLKGWPCPSIVDAVAAPAANVTVLEGQIGSLNSNGNWVLGVPATSRLSGFVFRNGSADYDAGNPWVTGQDYQQVSYGGVQGISLANPLIIQTSQFGANSQLPATSLASIKPGGGGNTTGAIINDVATGAATPVPAWGDELYADVDGYLKVAVQANGTVTVGGQQIIGIVSAPPTQGAGEGPVTYITFIPDNSKRLAGVTTATI